MFHGVLNLNYLNIACMKIINISIITNSPILSLDYSLFQYANFRTQEMQSLYFFKKMKKNELQNIIHSV